VTRRDSRHRCAAKPVNTKAPKIETHALGCDDTCRSVARKQNHPDGTREDFDTSWGLVTAMFGA